MPQICTICHHAEKSRINVAILEDESCLKIAKRFGVSHSAVIRHKKRHVGAKIDAALQTLSEIKTVAERRHECDVQLDQWLRNMSELLQNGNPEAVRSGVTVIKEKALLFGLHAPVEVRKAVVNRVVIDFNLHAAQPQSDPLPSAAPSPPLLPARSVPGVSSSPEMDLPGESKRSASLADNSTVDVEPALGTVSLQDNTALESEQRKGSRKPIELTAQSVPVVAWRESEQRVWSEYRPGRTMQEIATALGLTRSRVCQVLDTVERERLVGVAPRPRRFSNARRGKGNV